MKFHKAIKVITIGIIICLAIVIAASAAESGSDKNHSSQEDKKAGGGSGSSGPTMKPKQVSGREIKGQPANMQANKTPREPATRNARRHPLASPTKLIKDGAYIWCDPDGLWTVYWSGKSKAVVNSTVLAADKIVVESAIKATTKIFENRPNELQIEIDPNSQIGIIQFTSNSNSIDIDIIVNGNNDPNIVFIGSQLTHPDRFPLKLPVRRALSHKERFRAKSMRNQESAGTFGPSGDSILRLNKTAVPATSSRGGSSGGGTGGGKAKK